MQNEPVGKIIHALAHLIKRKIEESESFQQANRLTGTNGWIIGFLARRKNEEIYQKDVEKELSITRSTTSRILSLMEEKDLLERRPVKQDARLKQLVLTDKAINIHKDIRQQINRIENEMVGGFSEDEIDKLTDYLARIKKNLEKT